jgi:hypothetical protein
MDIIKHDTAPEGIAVYRSGEHRLRIRAVDGEHRVAVATSDDAALLELLQHAKQDLGVDGFVPGPALGDDRDRVAAVIATLG